MGLMDDEAFQPIGPFKTIEEARAAMADRTLKEPACPFCNSAGEIRVRGPKGRERLEYAWECGAWAGVDNFMLHGAGSVVAYDSACDYIAEINNLRLLLQNVVSAIDCWKVPLLDPDGTECSEAVMRLVADDVRKFLAYD